jgi:predicted 3-demethylubiquinone-9 3-methyltransferase (glyoxalase superfamily)
MAKMTPFLWFHDNNAEEAAAFYLSVFPAARKVNELRSSGVGPWAAGAMAAITVELMGQAVTLFNGGPQHRLSEAFSFSVGCKDQAEIDHYWAVLSDGGKEIACGWLQDKFGLFWQIVPEKVYELIQHPKAMQAMMTMVKFDVAALEKAARG